MENVLVSTSQNIDLEHTVASVGERIVAHFIDYFLFAIYSILVAIVMLTGIIRASGIIIAILFFLPMVMYDLICELTLNGQNIGKRVMKLKVVRIDGAQPSFLAYFIRWVFRIVDNVITFGSVSVLTIIITGKGQRLGDIAAGTMVVRLKEGKIELPKLTRLPIEYQPVFPEAINLSEKDYNIIREIIEFRIEKGLSPYIIEMMEKAKIQLQQKLHIVSEMNGKDFLYTLEKDYVFYNRQNK